MKKIDRERMLYGGLTEKQHKQMMERARKCDEEYLRSDEFKERLKINPILFGDLARDGWPYEVKV